VIPTVTPKVDPITDGFDYASLSINAVAVLIAVVAIIIAVRAQRSIADERRRQFELEILREFLRDVDEKDIASLAIGDPAILRRYQHRMALLPATDLRFWREVLTAVSPAQLRERTGHAERWDKASRDRDRALADAQHAAGTVRDNPEVQRRSEEAKQALRQADVDFIEDVRAQMVEDILSAIADRVGKPDKPVKPPRSSPQPN
jgi:hypothetical protein